MTGCNNLYTAPNPGCSMGSLLGQGCPSAGCQPPPTASPGKEDFSKDRGRVMCPICCLTSKVLSRFPFSLSEVLLRPGPRSSKDTGRIVRQSQCCHYHGNNSGTKVLKAGVRAGDPADLAAEVTKQHLSIHTSDLHPITQNIHTLHS